MKTISWVLTGLAFFLMLDALLAILLGKRYILWGLDYTPAVYREFVYRLSELPGAVLWAIKLAEGAAGFGLFWFARKLIR